MKLLIRLLVVLIVLATLGWFFGGILLDKAVVAAVEEGGTYALGVETRLKGADVGVLSGQYELVGLEIDNPLGFETERFLTLGGTHLELPLTALTSDVIEVPLLKLSGIELSLERLEGKNNWDAILESLERFGSGEAEPAEEPKGGKRFVIRELVMEDITLNARLMTSSNLKVPSIVLRDLGSEGGGYTTSELISEIVQTLLSASLQIDGVPPELLAGLGGRLEGLGSEWSGKLEESLGNLGEGIQEALPEGLGDKVKEGLGGLLDD